MLKQILTVAIIIFSCMMLTGFPSLIYLITTNNNPTGQPTKAVMLSGVALFLILLGTFGLYFIYRTDYIHYKILFAFGIAFLFVSTIGLQWLFNFAYG